MSLDLSKYEGHTPGPWNVNNTTLSGAVVRWHITGKQHGSCYPICEHVIEEKPEPPEQLTNALLIADAPQLLAELREARAENERLRRIHFRHRLS